MHDGDGVVNEFIAVHDQELFFGEVFQPLFDDFYVGGAPQKAVDDAVRVGGYIRSRLSTIPEAPALTLEKGDA